MKYQELLNENCSVKESKDILFIKKTLASSGYQGLSI